MSELKIDNEYIDQRIQTIFLNSKAIDNVEQSFLAKGSVLALSAAMPGLVGATFRRSGFYSDLRHHITHDQEFNSTTDQRIELTVKFFNMIAKELGPALLFDGVMLSGDSFREFILHKKEHLLPDCKKFSINEQDTSWKNFLSFDWENKTIHLTIKNLQ